MRLIDADAMDDILRKEYLSPSDASMELTLRGSIIYNLVLDRVRCIAISQPIIDAEPVVRCKDCEHRCPESITAVQHCTLSGIQTEDDDFCSYGAKMNGGKDNDCE